MDEIHGTYRNGHVDLDAPVSWQNGVRVQVHPLTPSPTHAPANDDEWGIDDDWPDTQENRFEIVRRMDAVEPLEMTPAEEAEWQNMLQWFDDYSLEAVKRDIGLKP